MFISSELRHRLMSQSEASFDQSLPAESSTRIESPVEDIDNGTLEVSSETQPNYEGAIVTEKKFIRKS